jgi:PAS domain S-box-containing protein
MERTDLTSIQSSHEREMRSASAPWHSAEVRFGKLLSAMVAHVDSRLPRAMCTSRARNSHVPRSFLVCVLSLWLTLSAAQALDPNKRLTQYAHTAWRIQDGFFPTNPYWISQTKDGYLWVGGVGDALRFDGVRFAPWSAPISSTPILHPVNLRPGEFWIATRNEITHVRNNVVISHYDVPTITAIQKDSDDSVWVLSYQNPDRVLCQATDTKIRCFGKAEGIAVLVPSSLLADGEGGFWIGSDTSLLHWKMGAAPEIYSPRQLQSNMGQIGVHSLVENSDGSLFVGILAAGAGLGLEKFRNGVLTPVVLPNFDGSKLTISTLMEDSDKSLWIATYGNGIYRIHGQTAAHFGRAEGLSSDSVFDLYEGDDGIVWATTSDGIDNFRDLPVTTFSASEGVGRGGATSVMASKDGTVWVANLGTIDSIRNGAVSSVRVPGQQVTSLLEDRNGNIWVGVDDALFVYKDGRFRRIPEPDHQPLGLVLSLTEDVEGNIWAECKGPPRRLIRIRDFNVREEFSKAQVPGGNAIAADPKGGIWLGAYSGDLTLLRDGVARTFPLNLKGKSWIDNVAHQIAVDPDGSVISASDQGFVMLRDGAARHLGKENGLPCDGVNGFAVDDDKRLWLNTPCGFIEIAAADVQRWKIHPDAIVQPQLFGPLDGARPGGVSFNPAAKSPDGRLWFVNDVVLQMIDPSHLSGDGTISPVYVEAVVADRKQYNPREGLQLPPLTRDLQIGYTSPSFLIPQKVKFRYRLDGHDRDWQDAGTRREAFYTQLGPGKYRFRVIASNSSGVWNEAGAALDFTIAPAFYQTVWFRALGVVLFLIVLAVIFRLRLRHLERQRDALRKSEKELRDVIDTIPAAVWSALPDGSNTYANKRFMDYLGLSAEQTAGSGWKAAIHPDDVERHAGKWMESVTTGQPHENESRYRRSDGQYRWHLDRGVPLRDEAGNIVKWYGVATDIEDRKSAEEALQQNQFYLAEGQRLAHMGSWAYNPSGFFEYWSQELFNIYGLDPQKGAPTLEQYLATLHPQDRDFMADTIRRMCSERSGCDVKKRIIRPDGEQRYIRCVGIPVVEGEVLRVFLGTAIDITEQELLTQESERRQAYLSDAQKLTHTGSWAWNVSTDELFWSEETFRIFEIDPSRLKPAWSLILDRVHPDDRASVEQRKTTESAQTEWAESEADFRIVVPGGNVKHLHSIAHPVIDASGQVIQVIGTVMDVTERKRVEDSLRRSESHLAEAQRLTHTGSWAWRVADRKTVHLSEEFYRICGFDRDQGALTLEQCSERVHPEDRLQWKGIIERAIMEKADYDREFRIILPNGTVKWIHTVGHPVLSNIGDLEGFVGSSTDVTELKAAEQQREKLRQLEADLAHINRVSTLGEMAASLAHEIKQPIAAAITSANTCIEWLAHEPPNLERARGAAARIDKYGNRAAEIIDRIRSFYKKSLPQRELVDVNGIIHEMLSLLKGEATRSSIVIGTDLSAELPKIMVDRVQLQQVFMNLMLNAIEAMEDSGGELTVVSQLQDGQLQFSVSDTGVGLPIEKMDQIFSAFFTTKPQGSGMGLAISRSIVESHGGQLWASATSGGGATFHFTLPIQVTESSSVVA